VKIKTAILRAVALLASLLAPFAGTLALAQGAAPPEPSPIRVFEVRSERGLLITHVEAIVPVPPSLAYEVMTDYEQMARFVPNLFTSQVTARRGNELAIEQTGRARLGPFFKDFHTYRKVLLDPDALAVRTESTPQSNVVFRSALAFSRVDGVTRLTYDFEAEEPSWVPAFLANRLARGEVSSQLNAAFAEMNRRSAAAAAKPAGAAHAP
jgi:hypothetical protein